MAFIPHTAADVAAMLAAIGVGSIEELFDEIPAGAAGASRSPASPRRSTRCRSGG